MENNTPKKSDDAKQEDTPEYSVTHRVYGGRERSVNCAAFDLIRSCPPGTVNGTRVNGGVRGITAVATEFTMPWRDYKVDITFTWKSARQASCICRCTPTTSQMIIRASSAPIKDFESRNLISANLWRAGFEISSGRWTKQQYKYKGDITLENVLRIAKQIHHKTTSASFTATVKQVLGTVLKIGLTTERKPTRFYLNRIEDGRTTFIDESEILPYLDEDGMPWHAPNPHLGRKTWYNMYPVKKEAEAEDEKGVEETPVAEEEEQQEIAELSVDVVDEKDIEVREELVCFHWLQKMCNKGDQCTYLHTMHRK